MGLLDLQIIVLRFYLHSTQPELPFWNGDCKVIRTILKKQL